MMTEKTDIQQVVLALTTVCNLACPECVAHIPRIPVTEHDRIESLRAAAARLFGIAHVHLSGGEPTAHPEFPQLVPLLKKMFGCRTLSIVTNGYKMRQYAEVLHHFDKIFVSHYPQNQDAAAFIASRFTDQQPSGRTLHVCTARRAVHPRPCARAYQVKYMYHRLYPCCAIPAGLEGIGIALTSAWRVEITRVALPCASCCFAEEEIPTDVPDVTAILAQALPADRMTEPREAIWPVPEAAPFIYGIDLDSWMHREAVIRIDPVAAHVRLLIRIASHAPQERHPITLSLEEMGGQRLERYTITRPGIMEIQVALPDRLRQTATSLLRLRCDPVFIPREVQSNSPDTRELGVRIVSLAYSGARVETRTTT